MHHASKTYMYTEQNYKLPLIEELLFENKSPYP